MDRIHTGGRYQISNLPAKAIAVDNYLHKTPARGLRITDTQTTDWQ